MAWVWYELAGTLIDVSVSVGRLDDERVCERSD